MCAIGLDVANHSLGNTTAIATKLSILLKVLNTLVLAAANRFLGLMHLTGTVRVFFVHFYSVGLILTMMNVSYDSVRSEGGAACKRAVAAAQRNNENQLLPLLYEWRSPSSSPPYFHFLPRPEP